MSTEAANGSATVVTSDAGTPDPANGGGDQGSKAAAAEPFAGLETGARDWVGTKGYKTVADVVTAAQNAESLIGRSVQIPDDKSKPEDRERFFNRLGRPEKADGYELKLPDGVPKDMPYDADFATTFKADAHKLGLTQAQAAGVHDLYVGSYAKAFRAAADAMVADATAATAALEKEFGGARGSEPFKQAVSLVGKFIADNGGKDLEVELKEAGVLSPEGAVLMPRLATALWKLSKQLYREDALEPGGGNAAAGDNPFVDGGNMTLQMQMLANDRARAERLIVAAGKKLEDFVFQRPAA